MKTPATYDEWLAFSDDDREATKQTWNAYQREGYGFPLIAAGRLALTSSVKVLEAKVGTYHCGEYILMMIVADEDVPKMPARLEQSFEGFRVMWLPLSTFMVKE